MGVERRAEEHELASFAQISSLSLLKLSSDVPNRIEDDEPGLIDLYGLEDTCDFLRRGLLPVAEIGCRPFEAASPRVAAVDVGE